jgi:hypothetical protein
MRRSSKSKKPLKAPKLTLMVIAHLRSVLFVIVHLLFFLIIFVHSLNFSYFWVEFRTSVRRAVKLKEAVFVCMSGTVEKRPFYKTSSVERAVEGMTEFDCLAEACGADAVQGSKFLGEKLPDRSRGQNSARRTYLLVMAQGISYAALALGGTELNRCGGPGGIAPLTVWTGTVMFCIRGRWIGFFTREWNLATKDRILQRGTRP